MEYRVLTVVAVGLLTSVALPWQLRAQVGPAAGGRAPATVRRVAGCYQLTTGAWSGQLPAEGLPDEQRPPAWFALDSVPQARPRDVLYAVQPTTLGPRSNRPASSPRTPAYWRPVGTDSALIAWSNGYMGVTRRGSVAARHLRCSRRAGARRRPPAGRRRIRRGTTSRVDQFDLGVSPHNASARALFDHMGFRATMVEMRAELQEM